MRRALRSGGHLMALSLPRNDVQVHQMNLIGRCAPYSGLRCGAKDGRRASGTVGVATSDPAASSTRAVLRDPRVRVLLIGLTISKVGGWMNQVALGWMALSLTGSPFVLGLVSLASALPVLILALPAGLIADRVDRARIVAATSSASAVAYLVMSVLALTGQMSVAALLITASAAGCATAVETPALQSLMGQVAGPARMTKVISLYALAFNVTRVIGPALGGAALIGLGAGAVFLLNAASFLPLVVGLFVVPMHALPSRDAGSGAVRAVLDAAAFVRQHRPIRALLLLLAVDVSFGASFVVFAPAVANDIGAGPEGVGLLLSAAGIGAVGAGLLLAMIPRHVPRHRILLISGSVMAIAQAGMVLGPDLAIRAASAGLAGAGLIAYNSTTTVLIHLLTPNEMRGRVMSFFALAIGVAPVGTLAVGAVASQAGITAALVAASVTWALALALAIWRAPILRTL